MSERVKANPNASTDQQPVLLTAGAEFLDGSSITGPGGGVVFDSGTGSYYSVARVEMVPKGEPTRRTTEGYTVPANRVGCISILDHTESQPTTYGAELEAGHLRPDGTYADLPTEQLLKVKELYTFMTETGTKPTDSPDQFRTNYWEMVHNLVANAESLGHLVMAAAVFGQHAPHAGQVNPSPYVRHVVEMMYARTGFATTEMFRTMGAQDHTGLSNTRAGVQAAEAMQYLNPILMAPTLSGPHAAGGVMEDLAHFTFTPLQEAHMAAMGVTRDDLSEPYQSLRYLFRRMGSPSAGIWQRPAADTIEDYLERAHQGLAEGTFNNSDRLQGWHTDRVRLVLDGSGANTFEGCAADPALGNPDVNVPLHLLRAALVTRLEQMALEGKDPRQEVAQKLGIDGLSRQARLNRAHHLSLRESSRYGNDATLYQGKTPREWLNDLLALAEQAPYTRLSEADVRQLQRSFAGKAASEVAMRQWCRDNNQPYPTAQTWFDMGGINNPAVYMRRHWEALHQQQPKASKSELIRQVELAAAKALHRASHKNQ